MVEDEDLFHTVVMDAEQGQSSLMSCRSKTERKGDRCREQLDHVTVVPVIRVFSSSVADSNEGSRGNLNTCSCLPVLEICTQEKNMVFRPLLVKRCFNLFYLRPENVDVFNVY